METGEQTDKDKHPVECKIAIMLIIFLLFFFFLAYMVFYMLLIPSTVELLHFA